MKHKEGRNARFLPLHIVKCILWQKWDINLGGFWVHFGNIRPSGSFGGGRKAERVLGGVGVALRLNPRATDTKPPCGGWTSWYRGRVWLAGLGRRSSVKISRGFGVGAAGNGRGRGWR